MPLIQIPYAGRIDHLRRRRQLETAGYAWRSYRSSHSNRKSRSSSLGGGTLASNWPRSRYGLRRALIARIEILVPRRGRGRKRSFESLQQSFDPDPGLPGPRCVADCPSVRLAVPQPVYPNAIKGAVGRPITRMSHRGCGGRQSSARVAGAGRTGTATRRPLLPGAALRPREERSK